MHAVQKQSEVVNSSHREPLSENSAGISEKYFCNAVEEVVTSFVQTELLLPPHLKTKQT